MLLHKGSELHYWVSGPPSAPLVVLTHGEGANHHSFDAQVQALARTYRVLTWDIRGHGQSKSQQLFTLEQAVDDLRAILAHEGYTNALFVGTSVGSLIAQLFAYLFPDSVYGLALLSSTPLNTISPSWNRFFDQLSTSLLHALPYWFIMAQMPAYLSVRPEVQKYTIEAMKESGREHFLAAWQAGVDITAIPRNRKLPQPLLVAFGAYDRPQWISRATTLWAQSNPGIRIDNVPGAGHSLNQDNPAYTNKMLEDFARQCMRERRQPQESRTVRQ
ncbi:MAG: alpha/beta hydrolase [Chloroflexi bacterium]|nr:MAG: alpha/beta hydrolase [Chloroflexota bacterium]